MMCCSCSTGTQASRD